MGILDHAKEIADLVKKYNDLDLYQKILDLHDEIFKLREENQCLRERVKELDQAVNFGSRLKRDGNVYRLTESDGSVSGPYCMTCWDADRKLVNLLLYGKLIKCQRCDKKN